LKLIKKEKCILLVFIMQMNDLNKEKILQMQEEALVRTEELFLEEAMSLASN